MRSGDHVQLAGVCSGGVELDADVEHGALHRMTTRAAVAVPGKVGQAGLGPRDLDDDPVAVEAVRADAQLGPAECADALQASVAVEGRDAPTLVVEVVDAVADLAAVDGGPPRLAVVRPSTPDGVVDLGAELGDLVDGEHALQVHVAGALEEVAQVVIGVVEGEGPEQIEWLAIAV